MKITHVHIENFRSILSLDVPLDDITVFIGPNNAGKSAIIEAVSIALSRRWGQQGTGFTENDVHCQDEKTDPRTAPPVKVSIFLEEPAANTWPAEMVADLEDIMTIMPSGLNRIALSVSYVWNSEGPSFEPHWEFLDSSDTVLTGRRRSINTSPFFNYLIFFWLGPLRDADDEFTPRSRHWGGLLKSIQIPQALESEVKTTLDTLDVKLLAADPQFAKISKTVGRATEIAVGEKPGSAKLRMLPLNMRDLVARAGVVLQNEALRPWLPLDHHGQGLQSLSVIFLFQAAAIQRLSKEVEGAEAVFAIEEPEVHLHPQAARVLWSRIKDLPGQTLVTTHSPYFVQNVPLHKLRIVRFHGGSTKITFLKRKVVSNLSWTPEAEKLVNGKHLLQFTKDQQSGCIASTLWFDEGTANDLLNSLRTAPGALGVKEKLEHFRHECRALVSQAEEAELSFFGRRVRGEIFFAREWILVEGPSEFLLIHAIGHAFDYDLDQHGISIVDFQNNGNASIYPALADAFGIPWRIVTDGDAASAAFHAQLSKRGFDAADFKDHVSTLNPPNNLEEQLLADGHEKLLRQVLGEIGMKNAGKASLDDLRKFLKNRKTEYMAVLAPRVRADPALAAKMPAQFVTIVKELKQQHDGN